jgi:hypothetical protein
LPYSPDFLWPISRRVPDIPGREDMHLGEGREGYGLIEIRAQLRKALSEIATRKEKPGQRKTGAN